MFGSVVILDLDGTIARAKERNIFYVSEPKNYPAAEVGSIHDEVIEPVWNIVNHLSQQHQIFVVTARNETGKKIYVDWLVKNDIPFSQIFCRKERDFRKDDVVKEEILHEIMKKNVVYCAIEDREGVTEMFQRNRIFVFRIYDAK